MLQSGTPASGQDIILVTGSSDGAVRVWALDSHALAHGPSSGQATASEEKLESGESKGDSAQQIGHLLGTCETGQRITCLVAFTLTGEPEGDATERQNEEFGGFSEDDASSDES